MRIEKEQYVEWRKRWSEIHDAVTVDNDDWVAAATSFLHQIEDARGDTYLTGLAKAARQRALEFKKPKRNVLRSSAFQDFLNAWGRVDGAIGMHLMDRPPS
ncbi:hypothetical protein [Bradyrhizobium sp. STM 3557]|uniref:hypothetical protein n=1 Tax=Bradyrhizobium sp. STM 3557 TaxID=578920 RepID=UPI00388D0C87